MHIYVCIYMYMWFEENIEIHLVNECRTLNEKKNIENIRNPWKIGIRNWFRPCGKYEEKRKHNRTLSAPILF